MVAIGPVGRPFPATAPFYSVRPRYFGGVTEDAIEDGGQPHGSGGRDGSLPPLDKLGAVPFGQS